MKDILHSIINVYEIKENLYPKVYRYVTMREHIYVGTACEIELRKF